MTSCGKTSSKSRTRSGGGWWNRCKPGFRGLYRSPATGTAATRKRSMNSWRVFARVTPTAKKRFEAPTNTCREPSSATPNSRWRTPGCLRSRCKSSYYFDAQRTWLEKAEHHCHRALALDPGLPEGHWARSAILWSPAKNFQHADAIAALEQVLAARPNFDRAHNRMADDLFAYRTVSRSASWPTSRPCGRIQRTAPTISSISISTAETSRAPRRRRRPG